MLANATDGYSSAISIQLQTTMIQCGCRRRLNLTPTSLREPRRELREEYKNESSNSLNISLHITTNQRRLKWQDGNSLNPTTSTLLIPVGSKPRSTPARASPRGRCSRSPCISTPEWQTTGT